MKNYYVKVDGGIGRAIAATGAVELFACRKQKEGDRVFVVSSFPFVFEGLNCIERVYPIDTPFLYEDKILSGEFIEPEPYNCSKYYRDNKHLSAVFNYLLNGDDSFIQPKLVLSENELAEGKKVINNLKKNSGKKKVMLVQPWGSQGGKVAAPGKGRGAPTLKTDESYRSFTTNFVESLCKEFKKKYLILNVRTNDQLDFKDMMPLFHFNPRAIFSVIPFVDAIVTCDSFLHHAASGVENAPPVVVVWGGTNEQNLGYEDQFNLRKDQPVWFEPNRIHHNHAWYVQKNKGVNEFDEDMVERIAEKLKYKKEVKNKNDAKSSE